jgi:tRNA(Ile)-lysidine synthase
MELRSDDLQSLPDNAAALSDHPTLDEALCAGLASLSSKPTKVAVAVSGGTDSATLAVRASKVAARQHISLCLFHIHHGLQNVADDWAAHVHRLGTLIGAPVYEARPVVTLTQGIGIEAAAREARYSALAELAKHQGVSHVLLAHHRDDQAETVLLRLLRGTGVEGLAAMSTTTRRDSLTYLRPWLDIERSLILAAARAYTARTGWAPVQDPTNTDSRFTRGALRLQLAPILDVRWPKWRTILTRTARHMAEAAAILDEVARADLATLTSTPPQSSFSLAAWRNLSHARQTYVLRYWLRINGARMPTEARLADMVRQLRQLHALGHDREMRVRHGRHTVCCHRGRVWLEPR